MMQHRIIFTPSGLRIDATSGESIYEAGLRAGVDIKSICGGKGLCKRCQVEITPGTFPKFGIEVALENVSPLAATEKKAHHDGDLPDNRRLSCRAKIFGDLVVDIPADSREAETSIKKKSTRINTNLDPAIQLHMIELPAPTLEDNPSDAEALIEALKAHGVDADGVDAHIDSTVLSKLQPLLKAHERRLIAVLRDGRVVVDLWPPSTDEAYGAAIDIGSTSLALYIYNLTTGHIAYEKAGMNPQIRFGEDLMSRVSYVMMNKGGEAQLTATIRGALNTLLDEAIAALEIRPAQLLEVIAVGNPIMHHVFLGINPVELGQSPFTLAVKNWLEIPARDLELTAIPRARVSTFPLIGGHVGADTTAAYLTQMEGMREKSVLLVDIGTNAEIVLAHDGRVAAASSPTGPALEGAEISSGVRASPGAIERVRIDPVTKDPVFKIIGREDWVRDEHASIGESRITGICGSGIFEVMVELANAGLIDKSGLMIPQAAPHRFVEEGKVWKYALLQSEDTPIYIKQTDIRAVQLAKAALYAGAALLAQRLNCTYFDEILLAGAFGTHLDGEYVAQIGIVPFAQTGTIRSIGNAAGMGAAMALLNKAHKRDIIEAVQQIEKVETATETKFQEIFVEAMSFPTAHATRQNESVSGRRRRRGSR